MHMLAHFLAICEPPLCKSLSAVMNQVEQNMLFTEGSSGSTIVEVTMSFAAAYT